MLPTSRPALAYLTTALGVWHGAVTAARRMAGGAGFMQLGADALRQVRALADGPHCHVAMQPELDTQVGVSGRGPRPVRHNLCAALHDEAATGSGDYAPHFVI